MKSKKILNLKNLALVVKGRRNSKQTVGLITGCFDVIHEGHVDLFRFAKKHVDILIVALDTDSAIKLGKGEDRPIHNIGQRAKILSELESVDYILSIEEEYVFTKESVEPVYDKIHKALMPHFLITTPQSDSYWERKKERAEKYGGRILFFKTSTNTSTSSIAKKISSLG